MHVDEARERVFLTADQHVGHANIIEYCGRPFHSVEEMDAYVIEAWNETVPPDGIVYHVGDFTLGSLIHAKATLNELNGHICVVPGSHDRWLEPIHCNVPTGLKTGSGHEVWKGEPLITVEFETDGKYPVVLNLCHYAMRVWPRSHYGSYLAYGHSHGRLPSEGRSMDVGVDAIGYHPMQLGKFMEELDLKEVRK